MAQNNKTPLDDFLATHSRPGQNSSGAEKETSAGTEKSSSSSGNKRTPLDDFLSTHSRPQKQNTQVKASPEKSVVNSGGQRPDFSITTPAMQFGSEGLTDSQKNQLSYGKMAEDAEKALSDYLASEEYQQNKAARYQQYNAEHKWDGLKNALNPLAHAGEALPSADGAEEMADTKEQELRAVAEYYRGLATSSQNQLKIEKGMEVYRSWPEADRLLLEVYANNRPGSFGSLVEGMGATLSGSGASGSAHSKNLTRAAEAFKALSDKYGEETVENLAEALTWYQGQKANELAAQAGQKLAEQHPVVGALAARGANLVGSITSPLDALSGIANRTGQFASMNPYGLGSLPGAFASAADNENAESIRGGEHEGITWGDVGATVYQAGMSALDNLARIVVGGKTGSLALAATGSFGQTVQQASAQGADPVQAVALGVVNGGLEILTEKVSLDKLLGDIGGDYKTAMQIIKNMLVQGGVEVSEEELSFLGSTLAEAAILQEKSAYSQQVAQLVAGGMSYDQAREQANRALVDEAAQTAIQSFLSGGMMSGVTSVYSNTLSRIQNRRGGTAQEASQASEAAETAGEEIMPEGTENSPQESEADQKQRALDEAIKEKLGVPAQNAAPAETNAVSNPIESYPAEKQNMIRSYIQAVDEKIKGFVQRVKSGDLTFKREKISDVSPRAAADIGKILGIDVRGFTHNINTNGVKHILFRHGENGEHDSTMAQDADISRVGWVLENYDSVEPMRENGEQVYSSEFRDKNDRPAPQIKFVKKIDGSYYVVEAACENRYKKLWVQSVYLQKNNGDVTQAPAEGPSANHETNARSALASPSPENSITEKGGDVNENSTGEWSVGAANADFSGKQAFNELLSDENAQPDRPGDARPMEIPKTDGYGRRVSEFAANAYGAEVTPDDMADRIQELIGDGALGFDTRTNAESLKNAAEAIKERGMASTRNQITRSVADGKIKDGDIEKALLLYATYANKKGQAAQDNAAELMVDLATMANITGRNLQLFKLLRKMTPEGQLMAVQKTVQRNVDKLNGKRGSKDQIQVEIPQELQDDYLDAAKKDMEEQSKDTAKAKEDIENAIYLAAASQIKATKAEKWNTWRYMAMLGNVKTQVRNVAGNAAFMPYTGAKRLLGTVMEKAISKDQRTKAIVGLSEADRALRSWAIADSKTGAVRDALKYSAKLGDDMTASKMEEGRRIFDSGLMENARKIVEKVPEAGDMIFKNREYIESLAGFMKARGYSAADIQSGAVSEAVLNEARSYAIQEAMKATFNDSNAFSDFISNFRYKGSNPIGKAANILGEGIMPFRRTPANIVVRMVENSPVNIARSLWNMATKVRTGDMSAATAIDQMASGLTGTGAMALGFLLAKGLFGIKLRGSDVDEDEERQGKQAYSIEFSFGGKEYSYTIDWAAPANLPLFVGANLYDLWENRGADTGVSAFTSFVYAMGNMFEPMLSLSCMSSLNDALESTKYAEEGTALYTFFANAATNYFTQGIPSLLRQTYQATQETKQQTFANSEDPLLRDLQRTAANIPFIGAAFQTDKVDEWGEEESRGNMGKRIFDAFFNPGTLKQIDTGALEQEITRLNESQSDSVSPPDIPKTISFTDEQGNRYQNRRLTEEEWGTLRTVQGQTAAEILNKMIASADYAALTDEQKAEAISLAYAYARETGRIAAISDYAGYSDGWMEGIEGGEAAAIIRKVAMGGLTESLTAVNEAITEGRGTGADARNLETAYNVYCGLSREQQQEIKAQEGESAAGRYIAAREAGVTNQEYVDVLQTVSGLQPQAGYKNVRDIQEAQAVGGMSGLSNREKETLIRGYVSDAQDANIDQMKAMGFDINAYLTAWRMYDSESGDGKKKRVTAEYQRLFGVDEATAEAIYEIYG